MAAVNNDGDLAIDICEDKEMRKILQEEMDNQGRHPGGNGQSLQMGSNQGNKVTRKLLSRLKENVMLHRNNVPQFNITKWFTKWRDCGLVTCVFIVSIYRKSKTLTLGLDLVSR